MGRSCCVGILRRLFSEGRTSRAAINFPLRESHLVSAARGINARSSANRTGSEKEQRDQSTTRVRPYDQMTDDSVLRSRGVGRQMVRVYAHICAFHLFFPSLTACLLAGHGHLSLHLVSAEASIWRCICICVYIALHPSRCQFV